MIEHQCVYKHTTFSTNSGKILCQACKLESYPVVIKPVNIFSPVQQVVVLTPREKSKSFCACGNKKTKVSLHCMSCASVLRKKMPPQIINEFYKPKRNRPDWVSQTRMKIGLAEKNIERWKNMIAQYERMKNEKK